MENEINVFGLRLQNKEIGARSFLLAYFDCDVRGIRLTGCALLLKRSAILIGGPRLSQNADRGARIIDSELAERVKVAALKLFYQFGGKLPNDGEDVILPEAVRAMLGTSAGAMRHD